MCQIQYRALLILIKNGIVVHFYSITSVVRCCALGVYSVSGCDISKTSSSCQGYPPRPSVRDPVTPLYTSSSRFSYKDFKNSMYLLQCPLEASLLTCPGCCCCCDQEQFEFQMTTCKQ